MRGGTATPFYFGHKSAFTKCKKKVGGGVNFQYRYTSPNIISLYLIVLSLSEATLQGRGTGRERHSRRERKRKRQRGRQTYLRTRHGDKRNYRDAHKRDRERHEASILDELETGEQTVKEISIHK